MLEDRLINPRIDKGDCIIESKNIEDIIHFSVEELDILNTLR